MSDITFDLLVEIFDNLGYSVFPDYSGRGMYGKICLGYEIDSDLLLESVADVTMELLEKGCSNKSITRLFKGSKTDSMGRSSIIVYFPKIEGKENTDQDND